MEGWSTSTSVVQWSIDVQHTCGCCQTFIGSYMLHCICNSHHFEIFYFSIFSYPLIYILRGLFLDLRKNSKIGFKRLSWVNFLPPFFLTDSWSPCLKTLFPHSHSIFSSVVSEFIFSSSFHLRLHHFFQKNLIFEFLAYWWKIILRWLLCAFLRWIWWDKHYWGVLFRFFGNNFFRN